MARKPKNTIDIPTIQDAVVAPTPAKQSSDNDTYHRSRCGGALRLAREAQGLSVQDVASKLRLGPKQIEALEADQFEKLPESAIVRGFIRNYAKLLKMNAQPLLDAYLVIVPSNTPYEMTVKPTAKMQMTSNDNSKISSYIWAGVLALLGLGVWLFYQSYIQKPNPIKTGTSAEILSKEPLPVPALPVTESAPSQPSTELTLPPAATTTTSTDITTPAAITPDPTSAVAAPPPAPVEDVPAPAPISSDTAKLEFNATQETWVNVIDASGREIYNKIIFADGRETIDVTPPVNVTVGNAGATSLTMNGKAVDLAPHSRNNVAHIQLE